MFLFNIMSKVNFDNIVRSRWPAEIFAANRTPKEIARVMYLIVSISTKKGANIKGALCGVNILKNNLLCVYIALIVVFIIMVNDSLNVIIMCDVGVNT